MDKTSCVVRSGSGFSTPGIGDNIQLTQMTTLNRKQRI